MSYRKMVSITTTGIQISNDSILLELTIKGVELGFGGGVPATEQMSCGPKAWLYKRGSFQTFEEWLGQLLALSGGQKTPDKRDKPINPKQMYHKIGRIIHANILKVIQSNTCRVQWMGRYFRGRGVRFVGGDETKCYLKVQSPHWQLKSTTGGGKPLH